MSWSYLTCQFPKILWRLYATTVHTLKKQAECCSAVTEADAFTVGPQTNLAREAL